MNRLSMTISGRDTIKRAGLIVISVLLLTGYYIALAPMRAYAAACAAPTTDYGTATATVKIDTAATYQIWSRISAADATNNSYSLEVDGNTCYVIGDSNNLQANTWTWVDYQNGSATSSKARQAFTAGNHTLKMVGREPGVKLGRVLLVSDLNCVPTGNGDNCAVAGDVVAPTVDITTPANAATVANTVEVTASATDNVAVAKVEFYVAGVLKSTDTSAPFAYTWDSKTSANGPVSLMVKAYDAAGNSNTDTVQAQVANGDTQAPSIPSNVAATVNAYNKVTLGWTASTDNTAVTGYRVTRNGVALAQVTSGVQYVDNTVLPNTSYSYQVSAYDAAGNNSALSGAVQAKTPTQPDTTAPSAPTNLKASAVSTSQINVSWNASSDNIGVASYDVYRAVGNGSGIKVANVDTLSYGDTGLAASTDYTYYVVARDSAGNTSTQSASAAARTQATPPATSTGVLKGRVKFTQNRERHAHVVISVKGVKRVIDTDSRGNFTINNLPAGTYKVKFQAQGSFSKEITVKIESGKTKTQNVTLRQR
ncbi:MAG: Ig-like domain-containing protein [Candidatus Saccharimonadales bacterium]